MTVASIMRRHFVTISPEDTLFDAYQVMRLARMRVAPVVLDGRLIGLLSFRDLVRACLDSVGNGARTLARLHREPVSSLVLAPSAPTDPDATTSLTPEMTLATAASRLCAEGLGCLPVAEASALGPRIVGLVTEMDLLDAALEQASLSSS
jgi:CBS domain-containing protein